MPPTINIAGMHSNTTRTANPSEAFLFFTCRLGEAVSDGNDTGKHRPLRDPSQSEPLCSQHTGLSRRDLQLSSWVGQAEIHGRQLLAGSVRAIQGGKTIGVLLENTNAFLLFSGLTDICLFFSISVTEKVQENGEFCLFFGNDIQENGKIVVFGDNIVGKTKQGTHTCGWICVHDKTCAVVYVLVALSGWEVQVPRAWYTMVQSDRKTTEK